MFILQAVNYFFMVLIYLIVGRAVLSWFVRAPYGTLYQIYTLAGRLTEPILEPFRRLLYRFGIGGTIDFSPLVAIIALQMLNTFILRLFSTILL